MSTYGNAASGGVGGRAYGLNNAFMVVNAIKVRELIVARLTNITYLSVVPGHEAANTETSTYMALMHFAWH